jgi:tetrahydromethanopterin S-methyltransferase subunit F
MRKPREQTTTAPLAYGCLAALVLLVVPAASFAVVFLWNVNALH